MAEEEEERRGISQPPHAAGQRFRGLRSLLDPAQIPSAARNAWEDQQRWKDRVFYTNDIEATIPLVGTDYVCLDQGEFGLQLLRALVLTKHS